MRVVLDTNVLVSAYVFPGGTPEQILSLALEERLRLITSRPLLLELGRVLQQKFEWKPDRAEAAVAQVVRVGDVVDPQESIEDIQTDPQDNRVLEAAAAGNAERIVSGDHHLLKLRTWRGIPILEPRALMTDFE